MFAYSTPPKVERLDRYTAGIWDTCVRMFFAFMLSSRVILTLGPVTCDLDSLKLDLRYEHILVLQGIYCIYLIYHTQDLRKI